MKTIKASERGRQGSILLLVVVVMALLATFAVSTAENSHSVILLASDERDQLHSRLAADSALAYTQRQLGLDQEWAGTRGWLDLGGSAFHIERQPGAPGDPESGFVIAAASGDAQVALKADFVMGEIEHPVINHAVAFLGGDADFNNVDIDGDLLAVDTEGGVYDFDPVTGEWLRRRSGGDPVIESGNNLVTGNLYTSSGNTVPGTTVGGSSEASGPIPNPRWNLDPYLLPSPDTIILIDVEVVNRLDTNKTVVVVNQPGTNVEFKGCNIRGGVVVWAPSDWPQRGPARNSISWSQSSFGMPDGGPGPYKHVGVVAPASTLDQANAANPGFGLFYFHEVGHLNNATFEGALWVVNDTGQWNDVEVKFNEAISSVDFEGMEAELSWVDMVGVTEFHAYFPERN